MRLLHVAIAAAVLVGGVAAIEPITTISVSTVVSIIGTIMTILSLLLDVIRYTITYTIFFGIVILIGIQFLPIVRNLDLVGFGERLLGDSLRCPNAGPDSSSPNTIPRQHQL
jgi:hypothetical protein